MRAVIQLNDYDPDELYDDDSDQPHDPHEDPRSVINGIDTEWYEGSGNIHVIDPVVDEVSEMIDGRVLILTENRQIAVENAELVTVHAEA